MAQILGYVFAKTSSVGARQDDPADVFDYEVEVAKHAPLSFHVVVSLIVIWPGAAEGLHEAEHIELQEAPDRVELPCARKIGSSISLLPLGPVARNILQPHDKIVVLLEHPVENRLTV